MDCVTVPAMSWKRWTACGALATATLGHGDAEACHEDPDIPGYEKSASLGFTFGIAFGGGVRFVYGVDLRVTSGNSRAAILRVEGRGVSAARLVMGMHLVSEASMGAELGLALQSGRRDTDVGSALAFHLAGGPYDGGGGIQAQAAIPFMGDLRNYEGSAAVVLVPNEWKLCLGSGRRLRDGESAVLPAVATLGEDDALARAWIEDARAEYASIWAFERMARELAAAGAPAGLIVEARRAADDEARHTDLCARMAGSPFWLLPIDDGYREPRWARGSRDALAILAREAWLDGCLGEGIAAAQAASAARSAQAAAADMQSAIAADERRHAELAWSILEWTWREGGARTRDAIAEAIAVEPDLAVADAPDADEDLLAAGGRLAADAARAATERETAQALERVRRLVG